MAIQRRLQEDELVLYEIITDPVWLGEFLRNTNDGSPNQEEWKNKGDWSDSNTWRYRWYQKDIISDKSKYIVFIAGRSVGKCHPLGSRIYTYPYGYLSIHELRRMHKTVNGRKMFHTYALTPSGDLVQKRAFIKYDKKADILKINTASGDTLMVTLNHPVLTPSGFKPAGELVEGDLVASVSYLPTESVKNSFSWHELRWLGYTMITEPYWKPQKTFAFKYQQQLLEMLDIAKNFELRAEKITDGQYKFIKRYGPHKHYGNVLANMFPSANWRTTGAQKIPYELKSECKENLKIFMEALLSMYATFTKDSIKLDLRYKGLAHDLRELLLRFNVRSRFGSYETEQGRTRYTVTVDDDYSFYEFFKQFTIPGVSVKNLVAPVSKEPDTIIYEQITSIDIVKDHPTYMIEVSEYRNYISDNVVVHNSVFLEDRTVYRAVNADTVMPDTKRSVLVTANMNQMTPLFDNITTRFMTSRFLKDFLSKQINRSKGTLDFITSSTSSYRLYARIAGSKGENNMVGLHVPFIDGDEMQLFPMSSWVQLQPVLNHWEENTQVIACGVPNGIREGNVLFMLDQKADNYKKYRIPATENPYWTQEEHINTIKRLGGEDTDDFQRLVLGRHGDPAFSVIPRDKISTEPYEFYSYRYNQTDKSKGQSYKDVLKLPNVNYRNFEMKVMGIDTGYTDPTVIQLFGMYKNQWFVLARWRLTRIAFPEQAEIIDWLDSKYNPNIIGIDVGPGGGGQGIIQDLQTDRFSKAKEYMSRLIPVNFGAAMTVDAKLMDNIIMRTSAKSYAGEELSRMISDKQLIFSEIDSEAISQLERVAYQKRADGSNTYFVLSDRGTGKSNDDHIFASFLVFVLSLGYLATRKPRRSLSKPRWA